MDEIRKGTFKIHVTKNNTTGESTEILSQNFPPEEALESLAARLRPLIVESEPVYYSHVLDSIEQEVDAADFLRVSGEPMQWWRDQWTRIVDRNSQVPQAFMLMTDGGNMTDRQIMYAWLYSDLVHADDAEVRHNVVDLNIQERFWCAAASVVRTAAQAEDTLALIRELTASNLLHLDPSIWQTPVHVTDPNRRQSVVGYYGNTATAQMPTSAADRLDPNSWSRISDMVTVKQQPETDQPEG